MSALGVSIMKFRFDSWAVGLVLLAAVNVHAQSVGEVEFSRGVGFAQSAGQAPRTLGKGLPLKEGDRLTTSDGSSAIIRMQDGTRMTVRPNSDLVVQQFQFKEGAPDNSMVMQLLRGGFRAITGLISKGAPNAAKVQTATATIGIRGTDFDARLCTKDCKAESAKVTDPARPNAILASAKLVEVQGTITAKDANGNRRAMVSGGSVYPGDTVETTAGARTVLVFRDDSRLTLGSNAQFRVDNFVFDEKNPTEGRFLVTLLRGSLRALTGLIGKANNRNVGFSTATATIGIRGTGLDLDCSAGASCAFFTWLGTIEVTPTGQSALQVLQAGQGLFVGPTGIRALTAPTLDNLPRPDQVPVNLQQLFGVGQPNVEEEGLFVFVRDGHIEVVSSKETLHLGRGEAGFASLDGSTGRPGNLPLFIQNDRLPLPNNPNPGLSSLLGDINATSGQQCR
ncbi:MAG: hypothetical protein E6Q78_10670 [Rhodoferax sp.]|nr:MAG: hypothetical protein E6Q78_10670 [Rhodoferax sp.]